jgi:hypothetical protein
MTGEHRWNEWLGARVPLLKPYINHPTNLLFHLPVLLYFVVWAKTGNFLWGVMEWALLTPIIYACLWRYDLRHQLKNLPKR